MRRGTTDRYLLFLCVLGLGLTSCRAAFALQSDDWPNWNGPNFEMIARETGWLKDWEAHPPKEIWNTEIGTGFSSVSVVGERLYTMGRDGDNDVVYCLDTHSGNVVWKHAYACALLANMHQGGPGSTPTVADGRVYTLSREGHIFCLNAEDGSVIWKVFLPDVTEVKHPGWGFTSSALVLGDKVIFESGRLVALNKNDGSLIWQTEKRPAGYGSPMRFVHDGQVRVATLNNAGLLIVDPASGKEIAFTEWKTNWLTNATTPIYFDGKFFLSTGYNRGCALYRFENDSLTEIFANRELSNHMNNSVVYGGYIYGISGNSDISKNCKLVCLDAENGEVKWSMRGAGCGSLLIADGYLVVLTDRGSMTCGLASPEEFKANGKIEPLDGRCWTVPVLANGNIFCRNATGKLVCLELERERQASAESSSGNAELSESQDEVENERPPIDQFFEIPKAWKRLGKDELWIDRDKHLVIVGGHICLRAGPLEMFACPEHTKEHESIVAVHTKSRFVHAALLAVGAKPGTPVQFDPAYKPAAGPKVKISVRWNQDGKLQEQSAKQMVRDIGTRNPMTHDWVFGGSQTWKDPETGEEGYMGDSGDLICVSNFGSATMDLPVESSSAASGLLFDALTANIPDLGTPVLLVLEPKVAGPDDATTPGHSNPSGSEKSAQSEPDPDKSSPPRML